MLKLKSITNQLFRDAGLPELTVGRDASGYVAIIGRECNQPILTIGSVQVGSKLTKAESDIIINEYIIPTITTYNTQIKDYIVERKKRKALDIAADKITEDYKTKYSLRLNSNYSSTYTKPYSMSFSIENSEGYSITAAIKLDELDKIIIENYATEKDILKLLKHTKTHFSKYNDIIKARTAAFDQGTLCNELQLTLSKACSF